MRKIFVLLVLGLIAPVFSGCEKFLDETPNKSGSAYIYHMDQLEALLGDFKLYRQGFIWQELLFRGDGLEFTPYYATAASATGDGYSAWDWNNSFFETFVNIPSCTWTPTWNAVFTFNTVLENMDYVTQTTTAARKQVEGEALFGRAYYHFLVLVQYALWDEDAPGIGYRTNTHAGDVPARQTVGYTLEMIYRDLANAEAALTAAGRTAFEVERNFRPTVPTVKALKARIDLYCGNYTDALANANAALAGYDHLIDLPNDPLYEVGVTGEVNVLNEGNTEVVATLPYKTMPRLEAQEVVDQWGGEAASKHPEFFLPHIADAGYSFANRELPISEYIFDLFDRGNDERWLKFYDNNYLLFNGNIPKSVVLPGDETATAKCFTWEDQQGLEEWNHHAYLRFHGTTAVKFYLLGMTTPEMYLIKAECLARAGQTGQAAEVLKTLRRMRFSDQTVADAIGGTVQEVLDERTREMGELWRFYDIKRLNGAENAGITVTRTVLTDYTNVNSAETYVIQPDDPRWALPFENSQRILMGWEQN